jgi:TonB-dependent receptor-like protein
LQLSVGQVVVSDVQLKVGAVTDVVEIEAAPPLIETEKTQQANLINERQVDDLPNITRNITQAVYTLPGVSDANAPRSQQPGFTGFFTTGFSIGGSNGRNNLSTIDGGENEYGTGQYRVTTIPLEGIQEFQVNRNGYNAEFGFTDGSAINIVTKSGANLLHGSAFGYFQDHNTSATNFFNGIEGLPAAYNQNVYTGFTLGGPVKRDKLFWYLAYEYQNLNTADFTNANVISAPTVVGPNAAQTSYVAALEASGDPFLVGFANGITPGLSPLNNAALKKILTAESAIFTNPTRNHNTLLRFDAQPNASNSLNLRLGYLHNDAGAGNPDANGLFTRDFSVLTTWTHTFSSSLFNQALVQVVPKNVANAVPNPFQGVNFSLGNLNVGNLGGTSSFGSPSLVPYLAHQRRYQFDDNLTWTRGKHTFKFGAQMHFADYHVEDDLWFNNQFDFQDGAIPLIALAPAAVQGHLVAFNLSHGFPATGPTNTNLSAPQSFAFGIPVDVRAGTNNPKWQGWGKYFGSFIQDSWKLNSRLTMDAGVRFDVDAEAPPLGSNFYASPRLGFAWDPFGDHKTVIRAGGGVYTAPVDVLIPSYAALLGPSGNYINEVIVALSATDPRVAQLWGRGVFLGELPFGRLTPADFAAVGISITPCGSVCYGAAPNYKNPYSVQASLSVDRQLSKSMSLELGYNMYHGVHLQMPVETGFQQINPGSPFCGLAEFANNPGCVDATGGPLYVPNPITSKLLEQTTYESIGRSIYHGLTTSLTKRYTHGLQFQANYTWSKSIDNVIDFASFQEWFRPSQLNLFRAVSVFDIPHNFVANAVYTTPFKAGTGNILARALADIAVAPIEHIRSGLPFSVRTPSLFNGLSPADSNFATPFHASRDQNRGANYAAADLRVQKSIFISRDHGVKMDFIAEGTNIFNRVNFNKVSDVFDNGLSVAGGQTVNLVTGPFTGLHGVRPTIVSDVQHPLSFASADLPRRVQFGLRLAF